MRRYRYGARIYFSSNTGSGVFSSDAAFPGGDASTFAVVATDVDADGDVDVAFGDFASTNELLLYTYCPDGGAQLHAGSACFACPPFMGRETPSMCLECISDVTSQGVFGTGESCAIPCVLQQRPVASDACEACTAFPGTFYDAALERTSTDPTTWTAPRCADCESGKYADTLSAGIVCLPCIPGKFAAGKASASCDLCPAGKFNTEVSATECDPCPAGGFCATGSVNSQLCPGARTCTAHLQANTSQTHAEPTRLNDLCWQPAPTIQTRALPTAVRASRASPARPTRSRAQRTLRRAFRAAPELPPATRVPPRAIPAPTGSMPTEQEVSVSARWRSRAPLLCLLKKTTRPPESALASIQ